MLRLSSSLDPKAQQRNQQLNQKSLNQNNKRSFTFTFENASQVVTDQAQKDERSNSLVPAFESRLRLQQMSLEMPTLLLPPRPKLNDNYIRASKELAKVNLLEEALPSKRSLVDFSLSLTHRHQS